MDKYITISAQDARLAQLALVRYLEQLRRNESQNTYERIHHRNVEELAWQIDRELRAVKFGA